MEQIGPAGFEFSLLEVVVLDREQQAVSEATKKRMIGWALDKAEIRWIATYKATEKRHGYNKASGGNYMPPPVKKKWQKKKKMEKKFGLNRCRL